MYFKCLKYNWKILLIFSYIYFASIFSFTWIYVIANYYSIFFCLKISLFLKTKSLTLPEICWMFLWIKLKKKKTKYQTWRKRHRLCRPRPYLSFSFACCLSTNPNPKSDEKPHQSHSHRRLQEDNSTSTNSFLGVYFHALLKITVPISSTNSQLWN